MSHKHIEFVIVRLKIDYELGMPLLTSVIRFKLNNFDLATGIQSERNTAKGISSYTEIRRKSKHL